MSDLKGANMGQQERSTEKKGCVEELVDWVEAYSPVNFKLGEDEKKSLRAQLWKLSIGALKTLNRAWDHADDMVNGEVE